MKKLFGRNRNQRSRRAATTVEFAMIAPILFFTIFACIEFGRIMLVQAFVEQSAFEAARNMAVIGATKSEGEAIVKQELSVFGLTPQVTIEPLKNGVVQPEIDDQTDQISATVSVNSPGFLFPSTGNIERKAVVDTERFEY